MGFLSDCLSQGYFSNFRQELHDATTSRESDFPESTSEPTPTDNSSSGSIDNVVNDNCPDCGGMGRTGGNHSYDTIGGACTSCGGSGKYTP